MGRVIRLQIPFRLNHLLWVSRVSHVDPQEHPIVPLWHPDGKGHVLCGSHCDLPGQSGFVAGHPVAITHAAGPPLLIGDGNRLALVFNLSGACGPGLPTGICPLIGEIELAGIPVVEVIVLGQDREGRRGAAGIPHAGLGGDSIAGGVGYIALFVRPAHRDDRLGQITSRGQENQVGVPSDGGQGQIPIGLGLHQSEAVKGSEGTILRHGGGILLSGAAHQNSGPCHTAHSQDTGQHSGYYLGGDSGGSHSRSTGYRGAPGGAYPGTLCRSSRRARSGTLGSRACPCLGQNLTRHGRSCCTIQGTGGRILPKEEDQQQDRADAVQLDAASLVVLHTLFNRLSGVVQAAFYRPFTHFHGLGNVLYAHLIVVVEQHAQPLIRGQSIHQIQDHPPRLRIV